MSWRKFFKPVNSALPRQAKSAYGHSSVSRYSSWLPEVYQGPPDRLQRYQVYETMNYDHEINSSLDALADFTTEDDEVTGLPFIINYKDEPTPAEVKLIERSLGQWCTLNEWKKRLWKSFRSTLMYGDQFFIRDPETFKLFWVDPNKVMKCVVNESEGKKIESYHIRDLDLNLQDMIATSQFKSGGDHYGSTSLVFSPPLNTAMQNTSYYGSSTAGTEFSSYHEVAVDGANVVQLTLSDGQDASWPFGISILERIYKIYKQKELLEDSILIYRVHRAPERRVFFIDVGTMPPNKAQQYLERIRYEVHQKRVPSRTGGGANILDSTYSPMSMLEDYFFATTSEGRGSKVETLPGGENLGQIDDLRYFNNKMIRALGVPSSYLPAGPEDGSQSYNDGRVGTAFIQEFRFAKICERHQKQIVKPLDREFKLFLKYRGINVDNSLFEISFTTPQSFSEYRQIELDSAQLNVFSSIVDVPFVSNRFALKRYLGWSDEELVENERMWKEEQGVKKGDKPDEGGKISDLGVAPSGVEGMAPEGGFEEFDDEGLGGEMGELGGEEEGFSDEEAADFGE